MRARHLLLAAVATAFVLVLSGCSGAVDAAKSQVGAAVNTASCSAISDAKAKLGQLGSTDPATLDGVSSAVGKVTAGLSALGSKVPAGLQDTLNSAKDQLDQAIAQAKTDPAKAQAALTSAGGKLTAGLDQLSTSLGC